MNKNEYIKKWFWNKMNSCFQVIYDDYPDNIYYCFDEKIERYKKLCTLNNIETKYPKNIKGKLFFYKNTRSKILYCSYFDIFRMLEKELSYNFDEIQFFINETLKDNIEFELYQSDVIPIEAY